MLNKIPLIFFILIINGCAGSPARIAMMSEDELKQVNAFSLCQAYDYSKSESAKNELIRRGVISTEDWSLIKKGAIQIGMSELALICSWGPPSINGSVNETVTRYGNRKQWVYRPCTYCGTKYVYTENGVVTSWQN